MTTIFRRGICPIIAGGMMLAAAACTDDVGMNPGERIAFQVSVANGWSVGNTSRSASSLPSDTVVALKGCAEDTPLYLHIHYSKTEGTAQDTFASRAASVEDVNDFHDAFGLLAYPYTGDTWDATNATPDFLYDYPVKKDEGYATGYYVPNNTKLYYFAYAPHKAPGVTLSSETDAGAPAIEYTVPTGVSEQEDLMVAQSDNDMSLKFYHTLTAVKFKCGDAMTIHNISLDYIRIKGSYAMESGGAWTLDKTVAYASRSQDINRYVSAGEDITRNAEGETFLMLPQTFAGENADSPDATITVTYTYDGEAGSSQIKLAEIPKANDEAPAHAWPIGTTVTYTLKKILPAPPDGTAMDFAIEVDGNKVYFAKKNLGATEESEAGYYYAWGETETKPNYSWGTYKWGYYDEKVKPDYNLQRYNPTDKISILMKEDDAAKNVLRGQWRMPTQAEWQALLNACQVQYISDTSIYGAKGLLIWRNSNGNITGGTLDEGEPYIFLPIVGYYMDAKRYETDKGYYWSSTIYPDVTRPCWAYSLNFSNGGSVNSYREMSRYFGLPVRPVFVVPLN